MWILTLIIVILIILAVVVGIIFFSLFDMIIHNLKKKLAPQPSKHARIPQSPRVEGEGSPGIPYQSEPAPPPTNPPYWDTTFMPPGNPWAPPKDKLREWKIDEIAEMTPNNRAADEVVGRNKGGISEVSSGEEMDNKIDFPAFGGQDVIKFEFKGKTVPTPDEMIDDVDSIIPEGPAKQEEKVRKVGKEADET